MYINPYILGPAVGAFFGYLMGWLMNSRSIIGTASWIPTFVVLGALAGLSGAARLGNVKKEDREKGEFLTETKSYKRRLKKKDKVKKD